MGGVAMPDAVDVVDDECISCPEGVPKNECFNSKRPCGHHCNCSWIHDVCHWCGAEFGEEEVSVQPSVG